MEIIRLNKYLADQGICSRRAADKLITEGAVQINGKVTTTLGTKINPKTDTITVDEQTIKKQKEELIYIALNKPTGYVTSTKKTAVEDKNVIDLLPKKFPRVFPVGRLDKDSSGLLLLTNDGELTFQLTHPRFEHEKEYLVEIFNPLTDEMVNKMQKGMYILGQKTRPTVVKKLGHSTFSIILTEGKNRQIRRMVRSLGSGVKTLQRTRIEQYVLPKNLKAGEYIPLETKDIQKYFPRCT